MREGALTRSHRRVMTILTGSYAGDMMLIDPVAAHFTLTVLPVKKNYHRGHHAPRG